MTEQRGSSTHPNSQLAPDELATYLARKIFEAPYGCKPDEVQRLQFRGKGERDLGGVCEGALVDVISRALRAHTMSEATTETLNPLGENLLISEKLLGWKFHPCGSAYYREGTIDPPPSFTTWAEAGLILDALQSMVGWESARACSQFGWLLKTRELTPIAIRAEALEYIRRQA